MNFLKPKEKQPDLYLIIERGCRLEDTLRDLKDYLDKHGNPDSELITRLNDLVHDFNEFSSIAESYFRMEMNK